MPLTRFFDPPPSTRGLGLADHETAIIVAKDKLLETAPDGRDATHVAHPKLAVSYSQLELPGRIPSELNRPKGENLAGDDEHWRGGQVLPAG